MSQIERPTSVRHIIVASTFLMSVLLYLHRFCISMVQTYIEEDLGLTAGQIYWIFFAFFLTYALGQIPSGWLTDRFGSRIMLTSYILLWSLFTGLTGAVSAFAALLLLRLGFGFSQAGAYPTGASIVSKWVPFKSRGLASGIISMGGRVGAVFAMFVTGYVLVWLTPASTPTAFDERSIMNPALFCHELLERPEDKPEVGRLRQRCFYAFSTRGQELVEREAERYKDALESARRQLKAAGENPDEANPQVVFAEADLQRLIHELNGLVSSRALFQASDLDNVGVEKEARRLARRGDSLNDTESQRLNRLVVEGLHRKSLMKLYVAGWRPLMFVYGSLGIIVAAVVWWSCHRTPEDHPRCNDTEAALIRGDAKPAKPGKIAAAPIKAMIKSRSMWCSSFSQVFTNIGWAFLMLLAPRYYINEHQLSIEMVGTLAAISPIAGGLGMFCGGPITDRLVRIVGLRWGRALPMSLSRFIAMAAYIACLFDPSPYVAAALFATVAFSTGLGTPASWAFCQDVGGKQVGSILGFGNMWGNLGAAVNAPLMGWAVGPSEQWNYAFITCAAAFFLSGIVALGINATIPIVPPEDEDE
jgi:nitrate/nitrite transporter NarK